MKESIYRQMREVEDVHWWFTARRKIIDKIITQLSLPKNTKILDAGCGTGGNLGMLSRHGSVTGVEMDQKAAEMARGRNIGSVLEGYLPDHFPIDEKEKFRLIVLLDVLEHIEDDVASLKKIKEYLYENGKLIITVPAFPFLWSSHDEVHHHKRRYTRKKLIDVIKSSGMNVGYISYYNILLFPIAVAVRIISRLHTSKNKQDSNEAALPGNYINQLLTRCFSMEASFIGSVRVPFGLSLIAVVDLGGCGETL